MLITANEARNSVVEYNNGKVAKELIDGYEKIHFMVIK